MARKILDPSKTYITVGVFGGAYRGKKLENRNLLTHLVEEESGTPMCRIPADNLCNRLDHSAEEVIARPTCPICAKKWDKLHL
jgi:hypothetical protein